jgi:hypothetical protein
MKADTPLRRYQRHIAHANHIIFKEVLDNLKTDNDEQQ